MSEALHTQFLRLIANHPEARPEITGKLGKVRTIRKSVSQGVYMIYVVRAKTARVEMWIYRGSKPHHIDEAKAIHEHFVSKRRAIEEAFGEPLVWNHGRRKSAYSIQFYYDDFNLEDTSKWNTWADAMVTDMNRLDDALRPHYL